MKDIYLYFENGLFLKGKSFGADGTKTGEVVFNTSMSGYEEVITDRSYAGQFIVFSMPEIGITGTNTMDMESQSGVCKGIITRYYNDFYSNFRSQNSLSDFLKSQNIQGITNIDTRTLIKVIRDNGTMMMISSTEISDATILKDMLKKSMQANPNLVAEVSTKKTYTHKHATFDFKTLQYAAPVKTHKKIVAIDFGIKKNILNEFLISIWLAPSSNPSIE